LINLKINSNHNEFQQSKDIVNILFYVMFTLFQSAL